MAPRQQWGRPSGWRAQGRREGPHIHKPQTRRYTSLPRLQALPSTHTGPQTAGSPSVHMGLQTAVASDPLTTGRRALVRTEAEGPGPAPTAAPPQWPKLGSLETLSHSPTPFARPRGTWGSSAEVSGAPQPEDWVRRAQVEGAGGAEEKGRGWGEGRGEGGAGVCVCRRSPAGGRGSPRGAPPSPPRGSEPAQTLLQGQARWATWVGVGGARRRGKQGRKK